MDLFTHDIGENIAREQSRSIGYRLLGWSIVSLWAVAVVILFRVFKEYPQAIDNWLLWVAPLLIIRSIGCAIFHKQFRIGINPPSLATMSRLSLLFGVSDGVLLLSLTILLHAIGSAPAMALLFFVTASLALTTFVYMHSPWVTLILMASVVVPVLTLAFYAGVQLPIELLVSCIAVLLATCVGVNRFKTIYLRQIRDKLRYQQDIYQAMESNFIFNEHWQKMHVAAIDWDRDGVIRSWNPAAERLFGISSQEASGQSLELLFDPETAASIRSKWLTATEDRFEPPALRSHELAAGRLSTCWYDTPLFHDGELIGIASFVIDLAERPVEGEQQSSRPLGNILAAGTGPSPVRPEEDLGSPPQALAR